jgi:sec-independent protein translocase protein TatB
MFPTGFNTSHILVFLVIALIVVGPKDLPVLLRRVGQFIGRMRSMAADFRASFEDMARQSELDELRKEVEAMRSQTQKVADQANEIVQSAALEHDPMYDIYGPNGVDPTPVIEPESAPADEAAPAPKPRRTRKKADPAPSAEVIAEKPARRRKTTPKDIVT